MTLHEFLEQVSEEQDTQLIIESLGAVNSEASILLSVLDEQVLGAKMVGIAAEDGCLKAWVRPK